jgi:hypothetical protein
MRAKPAVIETEVTQSNSRGADAREFAIVRDRAREIADEQAKDIRGELEIVAAREHAVEKELVETRELDALARAQESANRDRMIRLAIQDLAIGFASYLVVSMFLSEDR